MYRVYREALRQKRTIERLNTITRENVGKICGRNSSVEVGGGREAGEQERRMERGRKGGREGTGRKKEGKGVREKDGGIKGHGKSKSGPEGKRN